MTASSGAFLSLAFIMIGLKEIVMIGLVVLALYGRGGSRLLRSTRYGRSIDPWLNLVRVPDRAKAGSGPQARGPRGVTVPTPTPAPSPWKQGRLFWALALTAAAAVAAWVATRVMIGGGSGVLR